MGFDIIYPKISATTTEGKVEQVKSYLYQLADQLKWALSTIDNSTQVVQQGSKGGKTVSNKNADTEAQATFNSIKSLIITSADVVNAYYEVINERLVGNYVAKSDFGTYSQKTERDIEETSTATTDLYKSVQEIVSDIENLENTLIEVNAHIRSGLLYTDTQGVPVYGLEVGQKNKIDGVEVFNKYARFTSDRLSFYDKNDTEVAYISDYKLYITNAHITGTLTLGKFEFDTSDGLVCRWV